MALRVLGTVVGSGLNDQTGLGQITVNCPSGAVQGQLIYFNALLPVDTQTLAVGTSVWVVIAASGADQTAINGAVTLNPMSTTD